MKSNHPKILAIGGKIASIIKQSKGIKEANIKLVFGKKLQEIANELANETL